MCSQQKEGTGIVSIRSDHHYKHELDNNRGLLAGASLGEIFSQRKEILDTCNELIL